MKLNNQANYISEIKQILVQARQKAYSAVNTAMVEAYWLVGQRIVEEEQNGKERASYGDEILKTLSIELSGAFGKGFSLTNLKNFKKFYLIFSELAIGQTLSDLSKKPISQTMSDLSEHIVCRTPFTNLSWSHYERLIRVENEQARNYYLTEAAKQNWSVRTLDRNISTLYYS